MPLSCNQEVGAHRLLFEHNRKIFTQLHGTEKMLIEPTERRLPTEVKCFEVAVAGAKTEVSREQFAEICKEALELDANFVSSLLADDTNKVIVFDPAGFRCVVNNDGSAIFRREYGVR